MSINIAELKPGPELDAKVAEALGLPVVWSSPPYLSIKHEGRMPYLKGEAGGCNYDWAPVPRYSTDVGAAFKAVLEFRRIHQPDFRRISFEAGDENTTKEKERGYFECSIWWDAKEHQQRLHVEQCAPTPELAICLALVDAAKAIITPHPHRAAFEPRIDAAPADLLALEVEKTKPQEDTIQKATAPGSFKPFYPKIELPAGSTFEDQVSRDRAGVE